MLKGILPSVMKEADAKTDAERNLERDWYAKIKWWVALKQASCPVDYSLSGGAAKRQRIE